jgi:hypothetical protein
MEKWPRNDSAAALLLLLSMTVAASAQNDERLPVHISCRCDDPVGRLFHSSVKDAFARSPRYVETSAWNTLSSGKTVDNLSLDIATLDPDSGEGQLSGNRTIVTVVIGLGAFTMFSHFQMVCGSKRLDECAAGLISDIDNQLK